jgi:4'-phosphopantetheinyl transferase
MAPPWTPSSQLPPKWRELVALHCATGTGPERAIESLSNFEPIASRWKVCNSFEGIGRLDGDEIHTWSVPLKDAEAFAEDFLSLLSREEKQRSERFRTNELRAQYVATHGALRALLSHYLATDPRAIVFRPGVGGKPEIVRGSGSSIEFSLSQSHNLAIYAFCRDHAVGIDIERLRHVAEAEDIAGHFFCFDEWLDLMSVPQALKAEAFLNCWTRKEAFVKALGEGLYHPLDAFRVSLLPNQAPAILWIAEAPEAAEWSLTSLRPAEDYVGALAVKHVGFHLREWKVVSIQRLMNMDGSSCG